MSRFQLGQFSVNRVGYGAMRLAGPGIFGSPGRTEAIAVLRAAVEAGVDHIDTAQYYSPVNGLIREAVHPYPEGLAIVSKVGGRRDRVGGIVLYNRPDELRTAIEENLTTLVVQRLRAAHLRHLAGAPADPHVDRQGASDVRT